MTKGRLDKKQRLADERRKKRLKASGVWLTAAKVPPRPIIVVAARRPRPSVRPATAISEPLPLAHYPAKRASIGKRQVPGG
jgi:hypothetical protein